MSAQNWREEVTATDYFAHRQKQLNLNDRRPQVRRASDIVGPGIGAQAVRITNFNDRLATFNGFFSAEANAMAGPTGDEAHVGFVSSDSELGGVQMFYGVESGTRYRRVFTRKTYAPDSILWGSWVAE